MSSPTVRPHCTALMTFRWQQCEKGSPWLGCNFWLWVTGDSGLHQKAARRPAERNGSRALHAYLAQWEGCAFVGNQQEEEEEEEDNDETEGTYR